MIPIRGAWKRRFALVSDWALARAAPLIAPATAGPLPSQPRVLVIRCDHIGDAVMATAVLHPLRQALAPSRLDVLVGPWAAMLFRGHPAVDGVVEYATPWWSAARGLSAWSRFLAWARLPAIIRRIRAGHYDVIVDLRGDLRQILFFLVCGGKRGAERVSSDRTGGAALLTRAARYDPSLHQVEQNAAIVRLLGANGELRLDVALSEPISADLVEQLSGIAGPNGFLALALRGTEPNRSWPLAHAVRFVTEARSCLGLGTVYLGAEHERAFGEELRQRSPVPVANLAGHTSLAQTLEIFSRAAVSVCVDAGPMHLAAAAGSPVVGLFGPGDPSDARPWSPRAKVVSVKAPCGCLHPRCDFQAGPGRCMVDITPDLVLNAVRALLDSA